MKILITGGAGFIGCNLARRLLEKGRAVVVYDNLSRKGAASNLAWLRSLGCKKLAFVKADVRDAGQLKRAAAGADVIYHLAAQVAVTTSVTSPRLDFEINALGTFNALEAARASRRNPVFLYSSTNKVYGGMEREKIIETATRYRFARMPRGIPEEYPLDFHSPYGCSKGCGDQYTRDYHRIYGLRTIVFRQSCIYGARQFGVEDQGWLAHFAIQTVIGKPITIYGDGKQVRDVLFVEDLIDAMEMATARIRVTAGNVYNIGGGTANALSVWAQTRPILESFAGRRIQARTRAWRPGDQRIYVSDIRKAAADFGWQPRTRPREGLKRMWDWINENKGLFATR